MTGQGVAKSSKIYPWPACIANWKALLDGEPLLETIEYPIYTDAWVTGQVDDGLGPYSFINSFGAQREPTRHPSIVLRMDMHLPAGSLKHQLSVTNATAYHAGDIEDELSALLGLCLGIRTKAGGFTRRFDTTDGCDPRGQPFAGTHKTVPPLVKPATQSRRILPKLVGTYCLNDALSVGFRMLATLDPQAGAALVKAARLHQEALWTAEVSPEMSWFLLVIAVEACAKAWAVKTGRAGKRWGPTGRFKGFLQAFCPGPPESRPKQCYQHDWDRKTLEVSFTKVYEWRSAFVHEGILFPKPMCMPPHFEDARYSEIPTGLATSAQGGGWRAADTPLMLHLFEHMVRGAILEWWKWNLPSVPYLNTATQADLKQIPGIGPKHASSIVACRASHRLFKRFGDLQSVAGIGEKAAATIRAHTTLVKK